MNNEKLKQIRESITNTVSCIDSDNGYYFANAILINHLKNLTDMEAVLLRETYVSDQELKVPKPPEPPAGGLFSRLFSYRHRQATDKGAS